MLNSKKTIFAVIAILVIAAGVLFLVFANRDVSSRKVRVAVTNTALMAPLFVMHDLNLLENHAPGIALELVVVDSGTVINEAFIAGSIDAAGLNVTNFLVGADKSIPYGILSSLAYGFNSVQTNAPDRIKSFADIAENDRIAVTTLTGSSALLLYLASERYFGSYDALEGNIVTMNSADALLALINKSGITLAVSSLTERIKANEAGCVTILEDTDIHNEGIMNNFLLFNKEFYEDNSDIALCVLAALEDAIALIEIKDDRAISSITSRTGLDNDTFIEYLDLGFFKYVLDDFSTLEMVIDISHKVNLISSRPSVTDLILNSGQ